MTSLTDRPLYLALAFATIAVGLLVHLGGSALHPVVRDVLGDAVWAAIIVWLVSAIAPRARLATRCAALLDVRRLRIGARVRTFGA